MQPLPLRLLSRLKERLHRWPLRFYGLEAGRLGYIAQPEGCSYALSGLRDWLLERG